jgi:hypothetical protein
MLGLCSCLTQIGGEKAGESAEQRKAKKSQDTKKGDMQEQRKRGASESSVDAALNAGPERASAE